MLNQALGPDGGAMPLDRHRIERAIQALIDLLDASEPDPDLEPTGDEEPYLGWPTNAAGGRGSDVTDRESDPAEWGVADRDGLLEQWPSCFGEAAI